MTEAISAVDLYKIPSDTVLKHRKAFYDLWRRSDDDTTAWLNRVRKCIRRCKFPKLIEYLLIDKFVCELNRDEKNSIRKAANTWSFKELNKYFRRRKIATGRDCKSDGGVNATITVDNAVDRNQMTSEPSMVAVKNELVS